MIEEDKIAEIFRRVQQASADLQEAKSLLESFIASRSLAPLDLERRATRLSASAEDRNRIIEGVFDGQNMIGPDGKHYSIPANYASKSKLVEGDILKLTISKDGTFIYKQIGPVSRSRRVGILTVSEDERDFSVLADGKTYRVLPASVSYYKGKAGDEVTIIVPKDGRSEWAAIENLLKTEDLPVVESTRDRGGVRLEEPTTAAALNRRSWEMPVEEGAETVMAEEDSVFSRTI